MNYKSTFFALIALLVLTSCSDSSQEDSELTSEKKSLEIINVASHKAVKQELTQTKDYSIEEIYNSMCIECHSSDGSGNTEKLTPSMAKLSEDEMLSALLEVEADQGHVIMEHNRAQILKMGMKYEAKEMAHYMFKRFN